MAIRLRCDHRKRLVQTLLSGDVGLQQFAKYAREFTKLPISELPLIHFADGSKVESVGFSMSQMMPHAEQIIARLAHGEDVAAVILLAPNKMVLPFAQMFREVAADAFPIEVYEDTDRALDRLQSLLVQEKRRVPSRETPLSF
jgi:hypothetical protein